jgi:hypothetical protein
VVVHPGDIDASLAASEARAEVAPEDIERVIRPSRTLSAAERLDVYHGMYPLRMREALEADYPALAHFLGDERFEALVRAYVQAHPSRSFTLNRLGDHLPAFLEHADVPRRAFCHDLARLELAVNQAFDAEETPRLTDAEIALVAPEAWEQARLRPIAALRLLALRYPANAYLQSLRDDNHAHPAIKRRDDFVAVYRRDYSVYRLQLSRPAHALLADLAAGQALGAAIAAALTRPTRPRPEPDALFRWFREWVSEGLFQSVELG